MNKELQAIQIEQQLIETIGAHIINQLGQQRRQLELVDIQTFNFLLLQLQTFLFQSQLAYSFLFPSVGSFLDSVRTFFLKTPTYVYKDDALIKHDEFVNEVQSLIKKALNTLIPQQTINETPKFINMSDERVINKIETIFKSAREVLDKKLADGIMLTEGYLENYLSLYKIRLYRLSSDFDETDYAQIIDIALGRIQAVYSK